LNKAVGALAKDPDKERALPCTLHASFTCGFRSGNPKGILPQSPGLRGTSYPG